MNDAVQPIAPVSKSPPDLAPLKFAFGGAVLGLEALDRFDSLALCKKSSGAWRVRKEEINEWGEYDGWGTLCI